MAATVAVLGSALTTTAGNKTVTATPTVGDLIVVVTVSTGVTTTLADNGTGGAYTQVGTTRTGFSTSGNLQVWVRNNIIASASSTVYTATQTSSTGGGLVVLRVTGVTAVGSAAVRSSGGESTGTAGGTPAPVLSLTPLTTNLILTAVANASNSSTTLIQRATYTEDFDNGYNTPPTGLEINHLVSGETTATLTQGGTSATAFASQAIELIVNQPPTVALTTPTDAATSQSLTPSLIFTGTDADADEVEYELQLYGNTMKVLAVAGGGGGGKGGGGGGGGGGYQYNAALAVPPGAYTVTVGAGGPGVISPAQVAAINDGGNSVFSTITANGGGGGATNGGESGRNGGSGGGGGGNGASTSLGGTGSQGFNGKGNAGFVASPFPGGGGGGSSADGVAASSSSVAGNGGAGTSNSITGSAVVYAGGGGAGTFSAGGTAGTGGTGGAGSGSSGGIPTAGTANTGGGGGGAGGENTGGAGGSGVVIVSYLTAAFGVCTSDGVLDTDYTKTTDGANTVFTWLTTGNHTFTVVPLLDVLSSTESPTHFSGTGDPHPWPSGNAITYAVQVGVGLLNTTTYSWRVKGTDPLGTNTFGAYPTAFSFTTLASGLVGKDVGNMQNNFGAVVQQALNRGNNF